MPALVYKYRVNPMGGAQARRDVLNQPELLDQFRLAHQLRNDLVRIEYTHKEAKAGLWSRHPAVAEAETAVAAADAAVEELLTRAKQEHAEDRSTKTRPETARELAAAKKALKVAKADRRTAKSDTYAAAKPELEVLQADRKAAIKNLYTVYCQTGRPATPWCTACDHHGISDGTCEACGAEQPAVKLYWATYNAVTDGHRTALKLVEQHRKAGRAAQLRFHRWDGTGRVAVQLQKQAGDPDRGPALLSSGAGKWTNVLRLPEAVARTDWDTLSRGERTRAGRAEVQWCIGGGRMVTLPVQFHRPLPEGCEVLQAELVRTRIAEQTVMHLCLTIRIPDPTPPEDRPVIAVHTGWRTRDDGSVRVAAWRCDSVRLTVPDHLRDVIATHDTGHTGEIVLPARWLDGAGQTAALASQRSLSFDPIRDKIASWLDEHPQPATGGREPLTGGNVRLWRSPNRLAALATRWRDTPPVGDGGVDIAATLEAWRKQDKHLWRWQDHGREQQIGRRNDGWRRAAAWLADNAGLIVVDDTPLAELRRRPDVADVDSPDPNVPNVVADRARERATIAAPGYLRAAVTTAAARRGVPTLTVDAGNLTRTHRACAHTADPDPRYAAAAVVVCPHCLRPYDQDHNATGLMIDRAVNAQ